MINNINYDTYLNLTNQLLNCSSGEDASKILNNNKFLIDSKLVITIVQKASLLFSQNEEYYADTLLDIAAQLAKILQLPEFILMLYPSELESQLFLLCQLIQASAPGKVNFKIVDSLLFCNLDKVDEKFINVLKDQVYNWLSQADPKQAQGIASAINNISGRIEILPIGNIANNLEVAINGYEIAQTVFTSDFLKEEWVKLQNHLGNVYRKRIIGDPKENLNCSIHYFLNVLDVLDTDVENNQGIWAGTQHNLGVTYLAYRDRILDRKETYYLNLAVDAFNQALTIYNQRDFLEQWSSVQYHLGVAYNKHIEIEVENKAKYLDLAVTSFNHALECFTCQNVPEKWATIQDSLGNAYSSINESNNLELALNYYSQALQVHTKNRFPEAWARTQRNLGHTYWKLNQINEAKEAFELSLSVFTPDSFPWECLITANHFGDLAFQTEDWLEAMKGYDIAVQANEQRLSHIDLNFRKQEVLSETISVYANAAKASIRRNQLGKALEYLERSKTRNLVELLVTRDISPKGDIPETVLDQLGQLRRKIAVEQRRLEMEMGNQKYSITPLPLDRTYLNDLQRQLNELIQCKIIPQDRNFSLAQNVKNITFEQIQNLIPNDEAVLIEWYILNDKFLTFVVTRHSSQPQVIESSAEDLPALLKRVSAYLRLYYRKDNKKWWRNQLESRLQNFAEILHIDEIISHIPTECNQLILIPHRFLHLLPLHALPLGNKQLNNGEKKQTCLLDKFPRGVGYAPSCQLLEVSQNQQRPNFTQLFAIQNPTDDLSYSNLEVETIGSFFAETQVLVKQEATKTALNDNKNFQSAHCCHFSCHGDFNLISPLESALILADDERLTLTEIFGLSLNQCRLITLSACETGIADPTSISDEYISLPSGFLYAGSPSVVSSLWTVNDLSTAFLMIKFYQNLESIRSVAVALNQAQLWLRDITKAELNNWITTNRLPLDPTMRQKFTKILHKWRDNQKPFQNPFYWAAFCAIGQ